MSEDAQEQNKKQNYDWLKGYQFIKGQSGNPGGRPKGSKSLKTFVKEYLENLPEEEKIEYLKTLPPELVWRMAEGNPHNTGDITTGGQPIPLLGANKDVLNNNSNSEDSQPEEKN